MDASMYMLLFNNNGSGGELTQQDGKMILASLIAILILTAIMVIIELIRGNSLRDILTLDDTGFYLTEILLTHI